MADGDGGTPPPKRKVRPAVGGGEDTFTRRQVRQDMGSVPPKKALALLQEFEPLVRREAHHFARRTRQFPWFGIEDYLSVGQIAVIEAFVCYRPESGASLKTWVHRVVKWRLAAAAGRVRDPLELQAAIQSALRALEKGRGTQEQVTAAYARAEAHTYSTVPYQEVSSFTEQERAGEGTQGHTVACLLPGPEELCSSAQDVERVHESLKGLEHRQQAIIASELQAHGPSFTGLAGELGVSRTRLYQQRSLVHAQLRKRLADDATG